MTREITLGDGYTKRIIEDGCSICDTYALMRSNEYDGMSRCICGQNLSYHQYNHPHSYQHNHPPYDGCVGFLKEDGIIAEVMQAKAKASALELVKLTEGG